MEEKQREQKRARTVRSDYLADVDEVQAWIRQAELKVQDRSVEPAILRENLRQIQNELGAINDKLERLTRNGQTIVKNTKDDAEKELINNTIANLTEQLAQVRSWLEEKKQVVGDTLDAWQRFLTLYDAVKAWTEEKRQFLVEPLKLSTLAQARQRLHEYSTAVKSCKQVNKNLSDMGRELENIGQVTTVGDLPEKLAEAEEGKVQVEGQLLERNALLQEASEEWEQCERKMKDVRSWMEKARQTLELPQNKKKPLRDQHAIREKMLSDIAIQKTKITISVEKLEVHFRSGIVGDNRVKDTANDLIAELNSLYNTVKEQTTSLEACLAQIDQYQQEIQQLRQHIVQVEQQLRAVLSPTYMPNDREKALQEQQSLQQRMEDWKQRSKTLMDQIHAMDPYYVVPTNESRFTGQASYADIAAGRANSPSSRNCSPYRRQREATPPTTTAQLLRPVVIRAQKVTLEYPPSSNEVQLLETEAQENDANKLQLSAETPVQTTDNQATINVEECQQNVSEVAELSVPRRGRSPTRKINTSKVRDAKVAVNQEEKIDNSKQISQVELARNTLLPHEERRGRSPSPMWIPGSTSYADILRGCTQTTQANAALAQPPRQKMVSLSAESRRGRPEVSHAEPVADIIVNITKSQQATDVQQVLPTQEIQMEDVRIAETYCQPAEISTEKEKDQSYAESEPTNWADEALQDYNVLQHVKPYENAPRESQPTEIYNYMIPEAMPELVGFIGSHLGTYPVNTYVYAPPGHHPQVQQIDTINAYDNGSLTYAPEHFVAQPTYLPASDIYQQPSIQQPVNDTTQTSTMTINKSAVVPVIKQLEITETTESIDKFEQQNSIKSISNTEASAANKTEGTNTSPLNNMEIKGQTFSYAQILSHGLNSRVASTRTVSESPAANYQSKEERSNSPKEPFKLSSHELSPLQESKQDSSSFTVVSELSKQSSSKENDWDTMKKREVKKRQQEPNNKIKSADEKKSRKLTDKSKKKLKKEKLSSTMQFETQDESVSDKIIDSPISKEEELVRQEKPATDLVEPNLSQEKKRKQKKKKADKLVGDEIDKALKEIEDMDKQKIRHKDVSKKEKNKSKSKELRLETEDINTNQEKLEINIKDVIEEKSAESTKSPIEIEDLASKAVDVVKITDDVNENTRSKINTRKRDKTFKSKIKSDITINTSSITSTSTSLDKKETNFNNAEIDVVSKSEQTIDGAKITEVEEKLPQNKEIEHQTNIKLEAECSTKDKLEIMGTINEKEIVNSGTKAIEKIEKREVEKYQATTTKQKKSEKPKSVQGKNKRKEVSTKASQFVDNKIVEKKDESDIKSLIASTIESVVQERSTEKTNLANQNKLASNNSCFLQSRMDTENSHSIKIDEEENIALGQVNKRAPETVHKSKKKGKSRDTTRSTASVCDMESTENSKLTNVAKTAASAIVELVASINQEISRNESTEITEDNAKLETSAASKLKISSDEEKFNNSTFPLAKIDNIDEKTLKSPTKDETKIEFDTSNQIDKIQIHEKYTGEMRENKSDSEQSASTGKALIIEKLVTTVTTTTSVPGSVDVKPPDVKSVKSIEIIENIPLPKIVGSKVTELITLRPETVEASLTTTYARVPNDFLVNNYPGQSDQTVISQNVGLTSANSIENIATTDDLPLFGSVKNRKKICSNSLENRDISKKFSPTVAALEERKERESIAQLDNNMEGSDDQLKVEVPKEIRENNNAEKENSIATTTSSRIIVDDNISQNDNIIENLHINNFIKNDNIVLINKISKADSNILIQEKIECADENEMSKLKSKETLENVKVEKQLVPEYLLELIKPYILDQHAYNQAESNFYRHFKVVQVVKEPQPSAVVQTRPESVERIVQESVMKPVKSTTQETHEVNCKRHALIIEAPKYPITSFYEFESQWVKIKSTPEQTISVSSNDSEKSIETEQETLKIEAIPKTSSIHLESDDSWMALLEEEITIDDDFDEAQTEIEKKIQEEKKTEKLTIEFLNSAPPTEIAVKDEYHVSEKDIQTLCTDEKQSDKTKNQLKKKKDSKHGRVTKTKDQTKKQSDVEIKTDITEIDLLSLKNNLEEHEEATMLDETKSIVKKSTESKQFIDGHKSYAQVTASSQRISPQSSQEESITWVEEVEKETLADPAVSVSPNAMTDNEAYIKLENTWASIVGKKSVESSEVNDISTLEYDLPKLEQTVEQSSPTQVQIYVEEAPKQEPTENLVQVDEQGFMEFVNRKELRSRRSRSRSRSAKRDNKCAIIETSNLDNNNENKTHIQSENSENVKTSEEIENESKQLVQKDEDGQKTIDKSDELEKVNGEENVKLSQKACTFKSRDKDKQNINPNTENQINQETKLESDITVKGKKNKFKKNKASKDVKQQADINEQKELKHVEKTEEDKKSANENEIEHEIRLENINDQFSTKIQSTNSDQANSTKSKKKKTKRENKKEKLVIEQQMENVSNIDKDIINAGEQKIKIPMEPEQEDVKIKLEEAITTIEMINEQEKNEQNVTKETAEREIVDELKSVEACEKSHLEKIEKNIIKEKEIPKLSKAEKRKQKKKAKVVQSKSTDLSNDTNIFETVKIIEEAKDTESLKEKNDNVLKENDETMILSDNTTEETEKSLEKNVTADEIDKSDLINYTSQQIKSQHDSVNRLIKHSPPSDKLSSTVQQSFEENKLKRIASTEQESFDVSDGPPKPKVQFYIADEILVLNPDRRKCISPASFLQNQPTTDSFLSMDNGFWPDKRFYHEAERDHFESLALHAKMILSQDKDDDFDDRHHPRDRDDDNSGGGGGSGKSDDSRGVSHSLLGAPQTERMVADLPGGMCSWSDYSTYLSSESERIIDHDLSLGTIQNSTFDSGLSLDYSLPSDAQSSFPELSVSSSDPSHDLQTESRMESLTDVEITPRECPVIVSTSSNTHSSDHPGTCTKSSTFAHLRPQSKLHLGNEMRQESVERCNQNGEMERDMAKGEAERIRRIQDVEESFVSLRARLSNLEGTMGYLPRDSVESMLSSLMSVLTELRAYDKEATQLQKQLCEVPADSECQRLSIALTGIHTRIISLLDQAEQGKVALEEARASREKRSQDINTYKLFLEETDAWLKNVISKLHEQCSINTCKTLQEELTSRVHQVSELESLPEVSLLAISLKEALLEVINRLQKKQQEICDEEAQADDESTERDNATVDEAPSIHSSIEGGSPSLADVSLQTGQSLLIDDVAERKAQLTKQTSTTQMPSSTICHSLTTQTSQDLLPSESPQTQEAIKVLKTTTGDHDVIEIATKYMPSNFNQEITRREQSSILPSEDIVVDMKYQDAKKTDSATSELNIVHAAPQSFETVLVEPDDVTTEVVVDADGTKRIIVRKLRRTTVTSKQTTQQRVSTLTTTLGDAPPMVQAFSEAAMRDQQIIRTKTKPDGTIETTTKQIYGGKVITGAPAEGINVEEYESEPHYTRMVTQGRIGDITCQPVEEEILMEGGEYQTKTSSVHAVVQQVTRRIIKRTRKIIRKVTIVDGKEITTEEVIEEPEEVEIDEQDIPHISINVVKSEDQKTIVPEKAIEQPGAMESKIPVGSYISETSMQGPFFGPLDISQPENIQTNKGISTVSREEILIQKEIKPQTIDKQESEHFSTEVNGVSALAIGSQALIDAERSAILQTPVKDVCVTTVQSESVKSSPEPAVTDDVPVVTKATCKSDDAPVKSETLSIELENGTVEVETHYGDSSTVEINKNVSNVVVLEKERNGKEESKGEAPPEFKETAISTSLKKFEPESKLIVLENKLDNLESDENVQCSSILEDTREPSQEHISSELLKSKEKHSEDKALKSEYKPTFHKVEISLSVRKADEEAEPLVSIKTQAERPEIAPYSIVKEDVDISLPADKETTEVIHDKIVQTTASLTAEKETETLELHTAEKEIDVYIESSEKSKSDTTSHKSRKKKRRKEKLESLEKSTETESSTSIATSVAESMEINIPSSESSEHVSEQPQPDVAEIVKSITESSLSIDDGTMAENDGYLPEDKTMDELSITPEIEETLKKKKKKKKKQMVRLLRDEDLTHIPKTSSDDVPFTDDSIPLEVSEIKISQVEDKIKENKIIEEETKDKDETREESKSKDDVHTQTAMETCDVSTSLTPKAEESFSMLIQTSPEPIPLTLEEEIQTIKTEEYHIDTQTIVEPGLDFSAQTIVEETPDVEDSGVQTMTPTVTPMEELAVQTSPIENISPSVIAETEDSHAQTTEIDVYSIEMQTSPVQLAPTIAIETQTVENTVMEVEQQTTPPPIIEKIISQEISIQTLHEMPEFIEKDMQTSAPASPEQPDVSHTDTQTIAAPEITAETIETQTTPEESSQKVELQESEMQTKSPEPTTETMMQTSPELMQVCEESAQTNIEEIKQTVEEESQTSPKKTETLDNSVQIKTEELIPQIEESIQNIPQVCEIGAQTSPRKKQSVEMISISQQTTCIPTHTIEVSTEDLNIGVIEKEDLYEAPEFEKVLSEGIKEKENAVPINLVEIPAAPDVQVPETIELERKMEMNKLTREIPTDNIEQIEESVETETKNQLFQIKDLPKVLETSTKTKESTSSSEKDISDASFEIHVHATIELSGSDTVDSVTSGSKELTDSSQDTTIAEDLNNDTSIAKHDKKAAKRQKRKRKQTVEIILPSKDKPELEPVLQKPHLNIPTTSETVSLSASDQFVIDSSHYIPETIVPEVATMQESFTLGKPTIESSMTSDKQKASEIKSTQLLPEPMDTTEEPLSPTEIDQPILCKENVKPFRAEIKTYAEEISETPATSTETYEKRELWKQPKISSSQALSAAFLLKESIGYSAVKLINDRMKNLQNTNESSYLGNILHIAHLEEVTTDKLAEERSSDVRRELAQLRNAVQENDVIIVEETLVTVVETISTWLETIEYRIFLNKECPSGPSHEDAKTFVELKDEVNHVEKSIRELDNIWKQLEPNYPKEERDKLQECVDALEHQVKIIENVTTDGEKQANMQLARWDDFLNGISNVYRLIEEQRKQLDHIIENEYSTQWKLQELDKLENTNRCHMWKTSRLLDTARELLRDYPGKIIPEETYAAHEMTKVIEHCICVERERLLQLLALAEEYEQTLQEFVQIIEIAENLLDSPISVISLEHLQEEMQKHRKFFVNLNHCRAILESLEGNLDPETRTKHSGLHEELHGKATALLDQAASRAQQMALAASRWMLLEQGVKEERGWLQVAHQRVPDLQTVTSTDYDQYISLYQSLSSDVATHHARLIHLLGVARSLRDLINIEDPEDRYGEALDVIVKLQDNIESSLKRLLAFKESWYNQEILINRVECWMIMAEKKLATLRDPSGSSMRQFWELKAQYEVHNNMRNEADNYFEQALRIIPLADEILQRQFHYELQDRWNGVSDKINEIQKDITRSISSEEISSNEKLKLLERELNELRITINSFHGVLKTEEELDLYVERLTILFERISLIQNEIGRLGLLPAAESERVGILLSSARCIEGQIGEELDSAQLLREKIQTLQRGLSRFRKAHKRLSTVLDQCEGSERQESDLVAAAVDRCRNVADELAILWQDLMALRQMLHNLPTGMRVTVSPVSIERDLSNIQDAHTELESRCAHLLSLLTNRLELWRRFEKQLEMVQQSVQEADYMMELLTVQDSVDYDRLLKATERLEGLNGDLGAREVLVGELRAAAEPLRESCAAEVRERVDAAVNEAVQAWEDTRAELDALCTRYQHACRLWQQYKDSSAAVKAWVDTQMNSVVNLPPEEAVKQVKVCEETLAEHKERLVELRGLVAQIASDVGLDAGGPLHCEVEALGQRLEDVRETLSTLADTVDARVLNQELARGDLCQTKNFLDSVQQSLTAVGQGESNEQLTVLRNHLLALTRTEPQLQSIKDRALDVSVQEPSVVEVVQLWQRVFQETFQQYHRLSTRLIRSQDVIAALKLWEEYLTHVQDFLSSGMPGDYNGLSEYRNLCEVHRKLLPEQQNLILTVRMEDRDRSVAEQFNALTNLHNETLARILERHAVVRDRISAWDRYRSDQGKLLTWLKEIERERQRMHLQFIHLRRLDKILQRIQALLDKIPDGETQIESLQEQHEYLLTNCDETLAVSIRMEHAANAQRIANLRAGLETWRDFVQRVRKLHEEHVEQSNVIATNFQEVSQTLSAAFHAGPISLSKAKEQLDSLQHLRTRLTDAQSNLESLGVITEQLRECLSPSDMKTLSQHDALLSQQHGDLEYQLALLTYKLKESCALHGRWENRLNKLLSWMEDVTIRMQNYDTMALDEPEEAVKRFECELQTEMSLKQREFEWLQSTGQELIDVAEETEKVKLQRSLDEVNEKWNCLMAGGKAKANKLLDLIQTMNSLLKRISDLRTWLTNIESQLSEVIIIEKVTQKCIDKKLEDHDHLKTTIEAESGNIGKVLSLCEILLNDCDTWKASFNTDAIRNGMESLEKRWKAVCIKSTERKRKIMTIWKLLQELDKTRCDHEPWLAKTEKLLLELENDLTEVSKEESEKIIEKAKPIALDIEAHQKALKLLEQIFGRLAKSGLDPDNFRALTAETRKVIDRWLTLETRINAIISSIQREQKTYREFVSTHGAAVLGLTQVDVRLTQMQHLAIPEQRLSLRQRRQQLCEIEEELNTKIVTLRKADELALRVMQESNPDDVAAIQELVDEYQLLWGDIKARVTALKAELETQERSEVDEAVQVETLKFEQDTAVQVDTLPRLVRMTSCDAYLMELEAALNECNNALNALEAAVTPNPISGPGLNTVAKTIAKLIGSCQSSIELVRHLYNLLMEDNKLSLGAAKSSEVTTLIARYDTLIALARAREQQIRELSDSGRLTCPLCSRRNWTQLDNDLWRLDKWLEYAEGTQSEQHSPPNDIEQLEDVIQNNREFILDLDSHKSIVTSLNIVGAHLAEHTDDSERANELRNRLAVANSRWDKICATAVAWQEQLQHALGTNRQFYRIVDELLSWLERTEISIRASEPIDLTESTNVMNEKYNKFRELRSDLERCEPRVISLQEVTNHLLDEQTETRTRLQELRLRLQSLRRLTGIYALKLGAALGLDPRDVGLAATSTSLASLSHDLLDEAASGTVQPHINGTDGDERDRTVLARGSRFLGRVLRVSLPIQALMLLLLGVASLMPSAEEDYSCMFSNNLARSFTPVAFYPNGPPPV